MPYAFYIKIALIIIAVITVLAIISAVVKNISSISSRLGNLFKPYQGDFDEPVTDEDKTHLRKLAGELNSEIYGSTNIGVSGILEKINDLNDSDFKYLCEYYSRYFENSINDDVDNEMLPWTSEDENFLSRFQGMGL